MKVIEYKIITAESTEALTTAVRKAIAEGWLLQGGVSMTNTAAVQTEAPYKYAQAMVKVICS